MRGKRSLAVAAALAVTAFGVAACGSDSSSGGGDTSGGSGDVGSVGVILPDSASSARWETADRKFLGDAFTAAGVSADIQNANGDKAKFATLCDLVSRRARRSASPACWSSWRSTSSPRSAPSA